MQEIESSFRVLWRLASLPNSMWGWYLVGGGDLPQKAVVDGGQTTDMDCLAYAMVNWYLVTYEVAVVDAVVPLMEAANLVMDAMEEVVGEVLNHPVEEALDPTGRLESETNLIPAAMDVSLALILDSRCLDGQDIQKGACQDDRTEVKQYFRALEAVNCCCCPDCLDSE